MTLFTASRINLVRATLGVLILPMFGAACADRTIAPLAAPQESVVAVHARAAAISSTVSVTGITVETRYWDGSTYTQSGTGAESKFASLPTNVAGYTNSPVTVYDLTGVTNRTLVPGGAFENLGTRYSISLSVSASTDVTIRVGPDYGGGGALLVDGTEAAAIWSPFWSDMNWIDASKYLQASKRLTKGNHVITIVGFENCCDGGMLAEIDGGAGWQPVTMTPPPPPTYNGVTSLLAITMETRYWDGSSFTQSGAGATAKFESLPTTVAGYTNAPVRVTGLVPNQDVVPNGAFENLGSRYRFVLNTVGDQAKVSFRVAPDFGAGGVVLLDGVEVTANWGDFNSGYTWQYPSAYLQFTQLVLQPGTHVIEVVGFENCCEAPGAAEFDFGTGAGWQDASAIVPAIPTYALTVNRVGAGSVTSSPGGIACGATCSATYDVESRVTLTATPDAGYVFGGWTGACSGTGACVVTIAGATTVGATFTRPLTSLTVAPSGTGSGTVTSSPAGITCGTTCTTSLPEGTTVVLTATASLGSTFSGWGSACTGTGPCTVTVGAIGTVSPVFTKNPDSTPPVVSCSASPKELWPVNHKMVDITVNVTATDASGVAGYTLVSVTSNEPIDLLGDGKTLKDIQGWTTGTADVSGQLRAERAGNLRDRIYTLTYKATDTVGNAAETSCTVTVPHDKR